MPPIDIRKRSLNIEMVFHEGGPRVSRPLLVASACAVIRSPYAGRYESDLLAFMEAVKPLGASLAEELVRSLGRDQVEAYGKAAIVGVNGEMEHGAVWHEAGGWAMREALGEPKAIVPSVKAVAGAGYRLMVPLHHVHAAYVRSHFSSAEIGIQDAPRPDEILFALVMANGGRVHSRVGGLAAEHIAGHDGQR
ncbi:amino acid synthesis family protein [Variovorax sp. J22G73]|uniref:amino acid synthesis family protein n=1 Tax=unclassified Variovorax TaxID=663243 RepID=UPI002577091D|nr:MULTISPECIES: amino acid synthesis family protein [unclassified Variovorax]MDM0005321.1 amino acid synthesis family protein [Variovorax sp. J22R203]MDM0098737.1 amino acid synthesis family protein [Variovorax sp. J22G73]